METISIPIFQFRELSEEAQKEAISQQRYINVQNGYWYKEIYTDFCPFCEKLGVLVDFRSISFRGFYLQGDGSAFSSVVDVLTLLRFSKKVLNFSKPLINGKLIRFLENGCIDFCATTQRLSSTYMRVNVDFDYDVSLCEKYKTIQDQLLVLENWVEDVLIIINKYLYNSLQKRYEELLTDRAVREAIEANDYMFTVNGAFVYDMFTNAGYL